MIILSSPSTTFSQVFEAKTETFELPLVDLKTLKRFFTSHKKRPDPDIVDFFDEYKEKKTITKEAKLTIEIINGDVSYAQCLERVQSKKGFCGNVQALYPALSVLRDTWLTRPIYGIDDPNNLWNSLIPTSTVQKKGIITFELTPLKKIRSGGLIAYFQH